MGLLGIYTKRDFKKRTKEFKEELEGLYPNACQIDNCGILASKLIRALDDSGYPKGKSVKQVEVKAVDDRIGRLIASLKRDVMNKNGPRFTEYSRLILEIIEESRKYGKEKYDKPYYDKREAMIALKDELDDLPKKVLEIQKKQGDIIQKIKNYSSTQSYEIQSLERQLLALKANIDTLNNRIDLLQKEYEQAKKIVKEIETPTCSFQPLDDSKSISPKDFQEDVKKTQ